MGVEYYFFAPKENVIYDAGKWGNWEYFKPFLTSIHREWALIHENDYEWHQTMGDIDGEWPKDQHVEINISDDRYNLVHRLDIPKNVEKRSCFTDEFRQQHEKWKVAEEKHKAKIEKWMEEDKVNTRKSPEEIQRTVDQVLKLMEDDEE